MWSKVPPAGTCESGGLSLSAEDRGNVTSNHRDLLDQLRPSIPSAPWAQQAVFACLDHLRTSTVTAASEVTVEDAWVEADDAFCVVYTPPWSPELRAGIRRQRSDARATTLEAGALYIGPYLTDDPDDPAAFGRTVADFDIGEPLGNLIGILRYDDCSIGWWGTLNIDLPTPPRSR